MAFKMKGNPMKRNFGISPNSNSPLRDESPHTGKNPTHGGHSKLSDVFYPIKRAGNEVKELFKDLVYPGEAWKAEAERNRKKGTKKMVKKITKGFKDQVKKKK